MRFGISLCQRPFPSWFTLVPLPDLHLDTARDFMKSVPSGAEECRAPSRQKRNFKMNEKLCCHYVNINNILK